MVFVGMLLHVEPTETDRAKENTVEHTLTQKGKKIFTPKKKQEEWSLENNSTMGERK